MFVSLLKRFDGTIKSDQRWTRCFPSAFPLLHVPTFSFLKLHKQRTSNCLPLGEKGKTKGERKEDDEFTRYNFCVALCELHDDVPDLRSRRVRSPLRGERRLRPNRLFPLLAGPLFLCLQLPLQELKRLRRPLRSLRLGHLRSLILRGALHLQSRMQRRPLYAVCGGEVSWLR